MENNFQNKELTYKEMQEMLPDFVFGRLSEEEKKLFEFNLQNYTDLQNEVNQVKDVFGRIDEMELDKKITQKTRNLSIKVMKRM